MKIIQLHTLCINLGVHVLGILYIYVRVALFEQMLATYREIK